jgi:hypothetical protein
MHSGDRMSYHKSYEAAPKSLIKLRRSIVLRDEIVAEVWREIPATCREPVDDDPSSLLILKQALDHLSDEDKAYVVAGDWGFLPKIRSRREYQRYVNAYEQLAAKLTAELPERDDPKYDELFVAQTHSTLGIGVTAIGALIGEWEEKWTERDDDLSP